MISLGVIDPLTGFMVKLLIRGHPVALESIIIKHKILLKESREISQLTRNDQLDDNIKKTLKIFTSGFIAGNPMKSEVH